MEMVSIPEGAEAVDGHARALPFPVPAKISATDLQYFALLPVGATDDDIVDQPGPVPAFEPAGAG